MLTAVGSLGAKCWAANLDSSMLNGCKTSIIHSRMLQGCSRVSVVEERPCDAALVFPLFLIQDGILLNHLRGSKAANKEPLTETLSYFTGGMSSNHQQTEAEQNFIISC